MAVLWELEDATVAEVRDSLTDPLAYTTVLTILRTLERKGHIGHRKEGRAHRYYPKVKRRQAGRSALRRLTRKMFAGSPEALITQLVSDRKLDPEELRRIRRLLEDRIRQQEDEG